jgi:hypothetical protein
MSKPTFERFDYSLRPAKNIERKMLCEVFARLSRIAPLASYRYLGFGANTFVDFSLFHQRLGITDMISIEKREPERKRVEFNKPYSCIKMEWGESRKVLPNLKWKKRCLVWLDYERHLNETNLADVNLVIQNLRSGSMLVVTVAADQGDESEVVDETVPKQRMQKLISRVGAEKIPFDAKPSDLAGWGTGKIYRQIIQNEIADALNTRNGTLKKSARLIYEQCFNFRYADQSRMITVGGLIVDVKDKAKLSLKHFKDLEFLCPGEEAYHIEAPVLTSREVRYLNERLPRSHPQVRYPNWLPEADRKKYGKIYRYFPAFSEVEN